MDFFYEENKIYVKDNEGIVAEVDFPFVRDDVYCITHTYVSPKLRGQGVASELVLSVYKDAKKKGYKVTATCSYARNWFETHQEYQDIYLDK